MSVGSPIHFLGQTWSFGLPPLANWAAFPSGWVDPDDETYLRAGGQFAGGPGSVTFAAYTDSASGPFYELLYIPGTWNYSDGSRGVRGTRLYVSSEQVAEAGVKSFNLPKHLARFSVTEDDNTTNLSVSLPDSSTPFFEVTVKHSQITPVEYEMNATHIQPPIPGGVPGGKCSVTRATGKGKKKEFEYEISSGAGLGDGVNFPTVKSLP
ncbi:hypothetical protein AMATHDRAFT_62216, partial [Amanita thiersii Skay4041]